MLMMGITFENTPQVFGIIHISALLLIAAINIILFFHLKGKDEAFLLRFLHISGGIMLAAEAFKQYFCYVYVFDRKINLWFFPWQLCSMAMYCSFFITYLKKEKDRNTMLVFLSTFSLFADIIALVLPYDMLRDQIVLTVHSFAYHGLIICQSMIAVMILSEKEKIRFFPSVSLFLFMALIAEIINVISHLIFNDIHVEPDMFYITLSYPTTQPVFHDIALRFGIIIEIIVYLSTIILFSYLLFLMEKKLFFRSSGKSQD